MALLEADVNYKVAKDFCAQSRNAPWGRRRLWKPDCQQVVKIVNEEADQPHGRQYEEVSAPEKQGPDRADDVYGLQGNGKTTHAAKLGKYYRSQGRPPAGRLRYLPPAAIEQLKVVGEQAGVPVFTLGTEKIIAQKALAYAKITAMTLLFSRYRRPSAD